MARNSEPAGAPGQKGRRRSLKGRDISERSGWRLRRFHRDERKMSKPRRTGPRGKTGMRRARSKAVAAECGALPQSKTPPPVHRTDDANRARGSARRARFANLTIGERSRPQWTVPPTAFEATGRATPFKGTMCESRRSRGPLVRSRRIGRTSLGEIARKPSGGGQKRMASAPRFRSIRLKRDAKNRRGVHRPPGDKDGGTRRD